MFAPRTQTVSRTPVRSVLGRTPGGVAIFVWRAWTEYRRTTSARTTAIETGLCLVAGYAVARYANVSNPINVLAIGFPAISIAFILGVTRAAALANDLRRPLFWLSGATLFERLCALAVGAELAAMRLVRPRGHRFGRGPCSAADGPRRPDCRAVDDPAGHGNRLRVLRRAAERYRSARTDALLFACCSATC